MPQPAPAPQPAPVPKPTDAVIGPRIDVITPAALLAGQRYTLKLVGKNLSPDMKLGFGKDITIVGVPVIPSPTEASVDVMVSLTAVPGSAIAVATSPAGSNRGPGGVMISIASNAPAIVLDEPHDMIVATEQTPFTWHESQPGVASFFLFQLSDEDGKLLFSAQTTKNTFAITGADLQIMSIGKDPRSVRWSVRGIANKVETVEASEERAIFLAAKP